MKIFYKRKQGFTLIELLVVVAIIGIIVGLSLPGIGRWYQVKRVQDSALVLASTFENIKARAGKMHQPLVLGYVDDAHFGVFNFAGVMMPRNFQPNNHTAYVGTTKTSPWGGETMTNPFPSRVDMSTWKGLFTGLNTSLIVVMPNGSFRRFQTGTFGSALVPLGDIFRVVFTDEVIQASGSQNMKIITTWRVDVQPSGQIKVKRLDQED